VDVDDARTIASGIGGAREAIGLPAAALARLIAPSKAAVVFIPRS
jgi:hypothetical protein